MSYNKEKYCSADCQESHDPIGLCDFCSNYDFNGDENGAYTGDGYCNLLKEASEPYFGCEEFVCRRTKERQ